MDFTKYILTQWETWVFIGGLLVMIGSVIFIFINEKDGTGLFANRHKKCLADYAKLAFQNRKLQKEILLTNKLVNSYKTQLDDTEKILELYRQNLDKASKTITSKKGK